MPFNHEFWIPLQWPLSSDRLVLKVYDEDTGKADEIVGSLFFSLLDLCRRGSLEGGLMSWFNIRGSPINRIGQNATLMDHNPELGSTWKGRILMFITAEDCLQPEMRSEPMDAAINQLAVDR